MVGFCLRMEPDSGSYKIACRFSKGASRCRPGSKHHLICDSGGIPLAVTLTGGSRNDITQLMPLVDRCHRSAAAGAGHVAARAAVDVGATSQVE